MVAVLGISIFLLIRLIAFLNLYSSFNIQYSIFEKVLISKFTRLNRGLKLSLTDYPKPAGNENIQGTANKRKCGEIRRCTTRLLCRCPRFVAQVYARCTTNQHM
jgi:hypothetical protein